jgi:glyoxylase-like metal-dependent hydrolase (beta-lactamase superfamily II)
VQTDINLERAIAQVDAVLAGTQATPLVKAFFDEPTFTATYVVSDPATGKAAIIDSVLDFDQASGCTSHASADAVIAYVQQEGLSIDWLLETHAHADHLSAAPASSPSGQKSSRFRTSLARSSTRVRSFSVTARNSMCC